MYFLVLPKTNQQFPVCENVLSFISLEKAQSLILLHRVIMWNCFIVWSCVLSLQHNGLVKVVILCHNVSKNLANSYKTNYKFHFWGERHLREIKIIFIHIVLCFLFTSTCRYFNTNFGMIAYWFRPVTQLIFYWCIISVNFGNDQVTKGC